MSISNFHKPYLSLETNIGKEVMFTRPDASLDQVFKFSSTIDKIGKEWDHDLKNFTKVVIISESIEIHKPEYGGRIEVTKIQTKMGKEFWVPTETLVELEKESDLKS